MKMTRATIVVLMLTVMAAACGDSDTESTQTIRDSRPPSVYVVNYPLYYFTQRITGGSVRVEFPAPADVDPAFWVPAPEVVTDYQQATLILLNGAGYAKWVDRATLPRRKLIDTSIAFKDSLKSVEGVVTHSHGPGGEHSHAGTAFTTWIDLAQAARQAWAVTVALIAAEVGEAETLQANYESLGRELLELDGELAAITAGHEVVPLVASHPVYDYFSRRYALNIKSVLWEPDSFPSAGQWLELESLLEEHPARWMIWEGEPLRESVERLERLGVRSVVFDPCGNRPDSGDFMDVMKKNVAEISAIFRS
jgi:zinc transport system substrate-binding protein